MVNNHPTLVAESVTYYTKMLLVTMATKRRQPEGGLYLSQSGSFWMYMHMCLVVDSSDWRK